jgi:hypothetical protein
MVRGHVRAWSTPPRLSDNSEPLCCNLRAARLSRGTSAMSFRRPGASDIDCSNHYRKSMISRTERMASVHRQDWRDSTSPTLHVLNKTTRQS